MRVLSIDPSVNDVGWKYSTTPCPTYGKLWASDGKQVWEIFAPKEGVIPKEATAVKYWAAITIPTPNPPIEPLYY